jgi:hypothetical protein
VSGWVERASEWVGGEGVPGQVSGWVERGPQTSEWVERESPDKWVVGGEGVHTSEWQ